MDKKTKQLFRISRGVVQTGRMHRPTAVLGSRRAARTLCVTLMLASAAPLARALEVPFRENFDADNANWRDSASLPLDWFATGGPDGGAYTTAEFNFRFSAAGDNPIVYRAQDEFGSSGDAFVGDWVSDDVVRFSAWVRHNATVPLTFFVRFSGPGNFPGAVAIQFVPVLPNVWTRIEIPIDPASPQFVSFEGSDFDTVFSNVGHVQIGASTPAALAGVDQPFLFDLDKPTVFSDRRVDRYTFDVPSDDRWHYPFNFTPGTRTTATLFGAFTPGFNSRDGCAAVAWATDPMIPAGMDPSEYNVRSVSVTMTNNAGGLWQIDTTTDEWFTFDLNADGVVNGDGIPAGEPGDTDGESDDVDPGRPIELFGMGFGPSFSAATFTEHSGYIGSGAGPELARDPFPFVYQDGTFDLVHVENSVNGLHNESLVPPVFNFTPTPWAIGVPTNYTPGQQADPFDIHFDVDLTRSEGAVKAYYEQQLSEGKLFVYVTSLTEVETQGDPNKVPGVFMKEAVGIIPGAAAPKLVLELCDIQSGDGDRDCDVDLADFAGFQACYAGPNQPFPDADCAAFDSDGDGDIDGIDWDAFVFEAGMAL